jgi:type II secretory pathway component PulJ
VSRGSADAAPGRARTRLGGFTLIEVLGAILLTSVVLTVAVGFFINLSDSSTRAVESMRDKLRATTVLERVARDLSGAALLARAEDTDPLAHPWYFTASSQHAFGGSDTLRFISRSQRPKVSAYHTSDLAQVAYFTAPAEDGTYTLYRWSAPSLPLSFDPVAPGPDDPRSFVLAEGLATFLLRFRTAEGEWVDEWDSTQLVNSGELPTAVEVGVSIALEPAADEIFDAEVEPPFYARQVVLHQRPLDLAKMIEESVQARENAVGGANADSTSGDGVELDENGNPIQPELGGEGMTVAECVKANFPACQAEFGADNCSVWSNITSLKLSSFGVAIPPTWNCR